MLFCGVHPYRNQSNKILPLSFFLFFKERALCVACLVKKAITPVLSCYLVILLSCYSTPCFDRKRRPSKPPCVLTENLYPVLSCCLIVPSLENLLTDKKVA
jgi:hypothetical protein